MKNWEFIQIIFSRFAVPGQVADIPLTNIKLHRTWHSDCVWFYIQKDHRMGEKMADVFAIKLS